MSTADLVEIQVKDGTVQIIGADVVQTRNALELRAERGLDLDIHEMIDMVTRWSEDRTKVSQIEEVLRVPGPTYEKIDFIARIVGVKNKEKE